jgi:hypothetical protein
MNSTDVWEVFVVGFGAGLVCGALAVVLLRRIAEGVEARRERIERARWERERIERMARDLQVRDMLKPMLRR